MEKHKTMKMIKKYWGIIVGAILTIIAIIFANDKINKNKITKIDKKIDDNKQQNDIIQGKTEIIQDDRIEVKQDIQETKTEIETLQTKKENINPQELPVDTAKQNILNKTRRSQKPKK